MDVQIPVGGFSLWWLLKKTNRYNNALFQNNFDAYHNEKKKDNSIGKKKEKSNGKKKEKKYRVVRGCLLLLSEIYNYLHKQNLFKLSIKMALMWSSKLPVDIKYVLILSLYSMECIASTIDEKKKFSNWGSGNE